MKLHLLVLFLLFQFCGPAQEVNTTAVSNKFGAGNAIALDGKNQFVDCGNIKELKGTQTFTLETWIKVENYVLFGTIICNQGVNVNERIHLALSGYQQGNVANIIFIVGDSANNANYNTTSNLINVGEWIHIAASFDGTQVGDTNKIKIYINGKEQHNLNYEGSGEVPSITCNNDKPFFIGFRDHHGSFFNGQIDELRIWNTVRTKTEIRENMNLSLKGSEKGLVAYYQFDENNGNAIDPINAYDGTLWHNAKRQPSNLLLGTGASKTVSITQKGNYQFDGTNCSLYFPNETPNGEVTVTKIDGKINGEIDGETLTSNNIYDKQYWIIRNYGQNQVVKYHPAFNIEKNIISETDEQQPYNFLLNYKADQALTKWRFTKGLKAIATTGLIKFGTLQQFGTFLISSNGTSKLATENSGLNLKWLLVSGILLISIVVFLLYRSIKRRQKISQELAAEKKITETQSGEKLVLIQEIHHRVKNNLTMLQGLLYLQAKAAQQPETKQILLESQARIQSMALVHQKLYDGDNVAKLDFNVFIQNLLDELSVTYFNNSKQLDVQVIGNCEALNVDQATTLALIMNELATNSFKYAFAKVEQARINVTINQQDNNLTIQYADNGPGLPDGLDLTKGGFGFKMLNILADQVNANISYQKTKVQSTFSIVLDLSSTTM